MQRAGESRRTFQKTKCQNRGKDSAGSANLGLLCTLKGDEVKARRGDNLSLIIFLYFTTLFRAHNNVHF